MGQIRAEFRRVSEEKDAAFAFVEKEKKLAEESAQLADERKAANGLLQRNVTQLKTELTAFESQIDEFKKEKSVLLYNASKWEVTESQLQNEIVNLKLQRKLRMRPYHQRCRSWSASNKKTVS
jgi:chromosome segregation ATPase